MDILILLGLVGLTLSPTIGYLIKSKGSFSFLALNDDYLHKQPLFIISLTTPIILFLIFAFPALSGTTLNFDKPEYFDNFLELIKRPFWILATALPAIALIAGLHRSIQTKKQIIESESQNWITKLKYYKEEFKSYIDNSSPAIGVQSHTEMHIH